MVSFTELSKGVTRAAELLTVAAAHRAFVELCLGNQQQTGHQLADMVEGWVTGEDAIEVACWHMQPTDTCDLAPGERPRTAPHGKMPLEPKPEAPRRSTHGKRPRTGTGVCYSTPPGPERTVPARWQEVRRERGGQEYSRARFMMLPAPAAW